MKKEDLKKEDLKKDGIYAFHFDKKGDPAKYIGKLIDNGDTSLTDYIVLDTGVVNASCGGDSTMSSYMENCREATNHEIRVFHASLKAGVLVKLLEIDNLEIF